MWEGSIHPHALVSIAITFALLDLMLEELFLHGYWGLFGKLSVPSAFLSALTSSSRTHLMSKVTANGTEDISLWQEERWSFLVRLLRRFIVSKAMINLDCKTSHYLCSSVWRLLLPSSGFRLISLEGERLLMKTNDAHWREIEQCDLTELWWQPNKCEMGWQPNKEEDISSVLSSSLTFRPLVHTFLPW